MDFDLPQQHHEDGNNNNNNNSNNEEEDDIERCFICWEGNDKIEEGEEEEEEEEEDEEGIRQPNPNQNHHHTTTAVSAAVSSSSFSHHHHTLKKNYCLCQGQYANAHPHCIAQWVVEQLHSQCALCGVTYKITVQFDGHRNTPLSEAEEKEEHRAILNNDEEWLRKHPTDFFDFRCQLRHAQQCRALLQGDESERKKNRRRRLWRDIICDGILFPLLVLGVKGVLLYGVAPLLMGLFYYSLDFYLNNNNNDNDNSNWNYFGFSNYYYNNNNNNHNNNNNSRNITSSSSPSWGLWMVNVYVYGMFHLLWIQIMWINAWKEWVLFFKWFTPNLLTRHFCFLRTDEEKRQQLKYQEGKNGIQNKHLSSVDLVFFNPNNTFYREHILKHKRRNALYESVIYFLFGALHLNYTFNNLYALYVPYRWVCSPTVSTEPYRSSSLHRRSSESEAEEEDHDYHNDTNANNNNNNNNNSDNTSNNEPKCIQECFLPLRWLEKKGNQSLLRLFPGELNNYVLAWNPQRRRNSKNILPSTDISSVYGVEPKGGRNVYYHDLERMPAKGLFPLLYGLETGQKEGGLLHSLLALRESITLSTVRITETLDSTKEEEWTSLGAEREDASRTPLPSIIQKRMDGEKKVRITTTSPTKEPLYVTAMQRRDIRSTTFVKQRVREQLFFRKHVDMSQDSPYAVVGFLSAFQQFLIDTRQSLHLPISLYLTVLETLRRGIVWGVFLSLFYNVLVKRMWWRGWCLPALRWVKHGVELWMTRIETTDHHHALSFSSWCSEGARVLVGLLFLLALHRVYRYYFPLHAPVERGRRYVGVLHRRHLFRIRDVFHYFFLYVVEAFTFSLLLQLISGVVVVWSVAPFLVPPVSVPSFLDAFLFQFSTTFRLPLFLMAPLRVGLTIFYFFVAHSTPLHCLGFALLGFCLTSMVFVLENTFVFRLFAPQCDFFCLRSFSLDLSKPLEEEVDIFRQEENGHHRDGDGGENDGSRRSRKEKNKKKRDVRYTESDALLNKRIRFLNNSPAGDNAVEDISTSYKCFRLVLTQIYNVSIPSFIFSVFKTFGCHIFLLFVFFHVPLRCLVGLTGGSIQERWTADTPNAEHSWEASVSLPRYFDEVHQHWYSTTYRMFTSASSSSEDSYNVTQETAFRYLSFYTTLPPPLRLPSIQHDDDILTRKYFHLPEEMKGTLWVLWQKLDFFAEVFFVNQEKKRLNASSSASEKGSGRWRVEAAVEPYYPPGEVHVFQQINPRYDRTQRHQKEWWMESREWPWNVAVLSWLPVRSLFLPFRWFFKDFPHRFSLFLRVFPFRETRRRYYHNKLLCIRLGKDKELFDTMLREFSPAVDRYVEEELVPYLHSQPPSSSSHHHYTEAEIKELKVATRKEMMNGLSALLYAQGLLDHLSQHLSFSYELYDLTTWREGDLHEFPFLWAGFNAYKPKVEEEEEEREEIKTKTEEKKKETGWTEEVFYETTLHLTRADYVCLLMAHNFLHCMYDTPEKTFQPSPSPPPPSSSSSSSDSKSIFNRNFASFHSLLGMLVLHYFPIRPDSSLAASVVQFFRDLLLLNSDVLGVVLQDLCFYCILGTMVINFFSFPVLKLSVRIIYWTFKGVFIDRVFPEMEEYYFTSDRLARVEALYLYGPLFTEEDDVDVDALIPAVPLSRVHQTREQQLKREGRPLPEHFFIKKMVLSFLFFSTVMVCFWTPAVLLSYLLTRVILEPDQILLAVSLSFNILFFLWNPKQGTLSALYGLLTPAFPLLFAVTIIVWEDVLQWMDKWEGVEDLINEWIKGDMTRKVEPYTTEELLILRERKRSA